VQSAPQVAERELNLLRSWREPLTPRRLAPDVVGSLLVHVLILIFLVYAPDTPFFQSSTQILADFRKPTILYAPSPAELTQKAPNQGKVLKQLDLRSAVQAQPAQAPHPRVFIPPPGPPTRGPDPRTLQASQIDAPQLQAGPLDNPLPSFGAAVSGLGAGQTIGAPPKPPASPQPKSAAPKADPLRDALRAGGGGVTVGDIPENSPQVPGITPSPCDECSALQLLSDPKNVDFKPYLLQVLAVVKRHWLSVIPDSARLGRRGIVVLKFAIDRKGGVPQLEFTTPTGTDFDRAAIAGISASVPFPPFPTGFNGDQIRLQMAFAYNQVPH
jgi:TonB family protein